MPKSQKVDFKIKENLWGSFVFKDYLKKITNYGD